MEQNVNVNKKPIEKNKQNNIPRYLAWDFTCPDTLTPSHLNNAVNGPGIVACKAEDKKRAKYANLAPSFCFVPIAVETPDQRLSVAIQRGNAASVLGTVGLESANSQKLDADFYL